MIDPANIVAKADQVEKLFPVVMRRLRQQASSAPATQAKVNRALSALFRALVDAKRTV